MMISGRDDRASGEARDERASVDAQGLATGSCDVAHLRRGATLPIPLDGLAGPIVTPRWAHNGAIGRSPMRRDDRGSTRRPSVELLVPAVVVEIVDELVDLSDG